MRIARAISTVAMTVSTTVLIARGVDHAGTAVDIAAGAGARAHGGRGEEPRATGRARSHGRGADAISDGRGAEVAVPASAAIEQDR
mmetsp:Transcript_10441/g.33355  ORF Transcript_10441/g.33355 Transcript_10441/m.33355 type:complete len:86 (+) Transcript_10441:622-879(+)